MNYIVEEYQCRFRKGRGVVNQIFTLREIQVESSGYQVDSRLLFIDFKQA